eukprot:scaffold97971_cov41-Prasinocladus_malaysianus.AAC.1
MQACINPRNEADQLLHPYFKLLLAQSDRRPGVGRQELANGIRLAAVTEFSPAHDGPAVPLA